MKALTHIYVAIDLGGDTLKAAYAFSHGKRDITGKIVGSRYDLSAIDAVAKYDAERGKWLYASDVNNDENESFVTVVKIKSLLSLLSETRAETEKEFEENKKYYYERNKFPKFYFPIRRSELRDFGAMVKNEMTFTAEGYTPRAVCREFFAHVAKIIVRRIKELADKNSITNYDLTVSVVSPPHIGTDYVNELCGLVSEAFGGGPVKAFPMTKALGYYAINRGLLAEKESALIFNVGEEKTFVVKVNRGEGMGLSVDGLDGHNAEENLGGRDIDDAIANYLDDKILDRETMGTPSAGMEGHIYEHGLHSKQYLFLKNIQEAKIVLSIRNSLGNNTDEGVVVNVARDLNVHTNITCDEFLNCTGAKDGIVEKLSEYVGSELSRKLNKGVKKVFFTGGVVETYGLIDRLKEKLKGRHVKVLTFENPDSPVFSGVGDSFLIYAHEDAVYAPCLGCALATMKNVVIDTITALTYGVMLFHEISTSLDIPIYSVFLYSGTKLKEGGNRFSGGSAVTGSGTRPTMAARLYILSTPLTEQEIWSGKYGILNTGGKKFMKIGNASQKEGAKQNHKEFGMENISDGDLFYYYKGVRVELGKIQDKTKSNRSTDQETKEKDKFGVLMEIFVDIDAAGKATAGAVNFKEKNKDKTISVKFLESKNGFTKGSEKQVPATDITFGLDLKFQAR